MLSGLHEAGKEAGLTINTTKTKVLRNSFCSLEPVLLQGVALEDVKEYVYLGRLVNMKNDLKPEIERRKRAGWAAYNSIRTVLERASNSKLRADLFNSTVLPALCYACETWSLTRKAEDQTAQQRCESHDQSPRHRAACRRGQTPFCWSCDQAQRRSLEYKRYPVEAI
ncbi:hypothetical protein Q1695_000299 [Nippostrongylus brasiliensis]|nr:hypothetical protein Q1695_000299 [Nippostrongylus brasiliensis]